ncbi:hypothetical protein DFH28DRAFT_631297 [Melampsora americana]|nr:hypothetical protein DFH28DRAFT_631297 [Melampsora americana]
MTLSVYTCFIVSLCSFLSFSNLCFISYQSRTCASFYVRITMLDIIIFIKPIKKRISIKVAMCELHGYSPHSIFLSTFILPPS